MHNTAQIRSQRLKRKTGSPAFSDAVRDQKSIEQTFMDKGVILQGTKDEKNKKR